MKSAWDGLCVLCGIGRPRLHKTLCDRCLREWLRRQDPKRKKHKEYRGICVSWGYDEWHALHLAVIEYLSALDLSSERKHDE